MSDATEYIVGPEAAAERRSWWRRTLLLYATVVFGPVLLVLLLLRFGSLRIWSEATGTAASEPAASDHTQAQLLLAAAVVLLAARTLGVLCTRLGQPRVIGEIAAGIVLGPTVLGLLAPAVSGALFPPSVLPTIATLGQLGLLFFMFAVGIELDLRELRARAHSAVFISHASITLPFLLGVALSLAIYDRWPRAALASRHLRCSSVPQ